MPCDEDYYYDWQREKDAHAETRAKRDEIEVELRIQRDEALAHQCTPAERKVLDAMSAVLTPTLLQWRRYALEDSARALWDAELARRGEKP